MWNRLLLLAAAGLIVDGVSAAGAELPTYEAMGFPITPHQLALLGPANTQEQAPAATLTFSGMPASPHQIAVLTPRPRASSTTMAKFVNAGSIQSEK